MSFLQHFVAAKELHFAKGTLRKKKDPLNQSAKCECPKKNLMHAGKLNIKLTFDDLICKITIDLIIINLFTYLPKRSLRLFLHSVIQGQFPLMLEGKKILPPPP